MIAVAAPVVSTAGADEKITPKSNVPNAAKIIIRATRNPQSPILFTMKAFLPAAAAVGFVNQNEMSRYDERPTSSQPMNMTA